LFDLLKKKLEKFAEKVKGKVEHRTQALSEKTAEEKAFPEKAEKEKPIQVAQKAKTVETVQAGQPGEKKQGKKPNAFEEIAEPEEKEAPLEEEAPQETGKEPAEACEETVEEELPVEEKRELRAKVSIKGRLKAAITGAVELKESDLKGLLWELELALLEADVEQTTAEEICREIKQKLVDQKIPRGKSVEDFVKRQVLEILASMMQTDEIDLVKEIRAKKEKPYKILFLGPNGAGKTTSIAKLTHYLQSKGIKVIWAAGDTFRAASIEQLEKHAERLGIRVIKHQYGADPTAVAFDAVKAAQSKGIDAVLIDSAGRQETNRNLMGELEKISRVIKPDMKIYVGEAFTGQALLQQAKEYDKIAGIDAFILSKIDCDSKGGTTISLLYKLRKPILFVGTGQEYKDLQKFEPEFVLKRII